MERWTLTWQKAIGSREGCLLKMVAAPRRNGCRPGSIGDSIVDRGHRDSRSDEQGVFHFDGVAPGSYKLFAWDNIPSGAFLNADFLKQYEDLGRAIVVEGPISFAVPLKVIRVEGRSDTGGNVASGELRRHDNN